MNEITKFTDEYHFLSNFYESPLVVWETTFPSAEHAYQAAKTNTPSDFEWVRSSPTPGVAKRRGRTVALCENWETLKEEVMLRILREKFKPGTPLAEQLLATGSAKLVEGNTWGDTYWGVCKGTGQNRLGVLLMLVRQELVLKS